MTDKYAVIGNPIAHSKSPLIHSFFARQTGQDMTYERLLGGENSFETEVRTFLAQEGRGLNVTVPFKERAWQLADQLSERARYARAVNTLLFDVDNGKLLGDNTDGAGLIHDLKHNLGLELNGLRVLLIGAGGASRGVVRPLLEQSPRHLVIANRTANKARKLADEVSFEDRASGCGLEELTGRQFDIVVNGTSAGLAGGVPHLPDGILAPGGWVYDLMYADDPTDFVIWGLSQGATRAVDGLGMLVEQAAESFLVWRGVRPQTKPVIEMLRPQGLSPN